MNALVSTEELAGLLDQGDVRVVDVRWYLDPARRGRDAYGAGHVPGAVFMDLDVDLAAPGGRRGGPLGRHPWPAADQVERVMGAAGIGPQTRVVAYDDQAGAIAARLWYLLRTFGHTAVAVLDGGFPKWVAEGRPVSTETPVPTPAVFSARPAPNRIVAKAELAAIAPGTALVFDARAGERYRGESEPIDPRAGHVPAATSAPFSLNLTSGPLPVFRPASELRSYYAGLGAEHREPIVYCGSGVTACHDLLALHLAGLDGRLYAGSWSEWSSDPELPIATGA